MATATTEYKLSKADANVKEYSDVHSAAHFDALTKTHAYVFVDFRATWCAPCKRILPLFQQMPEWYSSQLHSKSKPIKFVSIDIDGVPEVDSNMDSLPAFQLYHLGKQIGNGISTSTIANVKSYVLSSLSAT